MKYKYKFYCYYFYTTYIYTTLFTLWKVLKFKDLLLELRKIGCPKNVRERVPHFTS